MKPRYTSEKSINASINRVLDKNGIARRKRAAKEGEYKLVEVENGGVVVVKANNDAPAENTEISAGEE